MEVAQIKLPSCLLPILRPNPKKMILVLLMYSSPESDLERKTSQSYVLDHVHRPLSKHVYSGAAALLLKVGYCGKTADQQGISRTKGNQKVCLTF